MVAAKPSSALAQRPAARLSQPLIISLSLRQDMPRAAGCKHVRSNRHDPRSPICRRALDPSADAWFTAPVVYAGADGFTEPRTWLRLVRAGLPWVGTRPVCLVSQPPGIEEAPSSLGVAGSGQLIFSVWHVAFRRRSPDLIGSKKSTQPRAPLQYFIVRSSKRAVPTPRPLGHLRF